MISSAYHLSPSPSVPSLQRTTARRVPSDPIGRSSNRRTSSTTGDGGAHGGQRIVVVFDLGRFDQRVQDAVRRSVGVADLGQRLGHLGDDPVSQLVVACCEQVRSGRVDDGFGFGSDCVAEGFLPDLVTDVVGRGALEVDFEDHRVHLLPRFALERGNGHGHGCEQLGLLQIVGDERLQRVVAVLLEPTLDEVCAATTVRWDVGYSDDAIHPLAVQDSLVATATV